MHQQQGHRTCSWRLALDKLKQHLFIKEDDVSAESNIENNQESDIDLLLTGSSSPSNIGLMEHKVSYTIGD